MCERDTKSFSRIFCLFILSVNYNRHLHLLKLSAKHIFSCVFDYPCRLLRVSLRCRRIYPRKPQFVVIVIVSHNRTNTIPFAASLKFVSWNFIIHTACGCISSWMRFPYRKICLFLKSALAGKPVFFCGLSGSRDTNAHTIRYDTKS